VKLEVFPEPGADRRRRFGGTARTEYDSRCQPSEPYCRPPDYSYTEHTRASIGGPPAAGHLRIAELSVRLRSPSSSAGTRLFGLMAR
jgi:hypothetical protein